MFSQQSTEDVKLEWMYKGPNSTVNREEYLLGRSVDKTLEQLNTEEKQQKSFLIQQPKNHVEHECIPPSIRDYKQQVGEQVDIAAKLQEDPLVAIQKREEESRRQFLNNPVQIKKLQKALKAQEKTRTKVNKSKTDLEAKLAKKLKFLANSKLCPKKTNEDKDLSTILMHKFNEMKKKLSDTDLDNILAGNSTDSSSSDSSASSDTDEGKMLKQQKGYVRNSDEDEEKNNSKARKDLQQESSRREDDEGDAKRYEESYTSSRANRSPERYDRGRKTEDSSYKSRRDDSQERHDRDSKRNDRYDESGDRKNQRREDYESSSKSRRDDSQERYDRNSKKNDRYDESGDRRNSRNDSYGKRSRRSSSYERHDRRDSRNKADYYSDRRGGRKKTESYDRYDHYDRRSNRRENYREYNRNRKSSWENYEEERPRYNRNSYSERAGPSRKIILKKGEIYHRFVNVDSSSKGRSNDEYGRNMVRYNEERHRPYDSNRRHKRCSRSASDDRRRNRRRSSSSERHRSSERTRSSERKKKTEIRRRRSRSSSTDSNSSKERRGKEKMRRRSRSISARKRSKSSDSSSAGEQKNSHMTRKKQRASSSSSDAAKKSWKTSPSARKRHSSSSSSDEDAKSSKITNWGLVRADGTKIPLSQKPTEVVFSKSKWDPKLDARMPEKPKRAQLTEEEKEILRREMMENAAWRDEERERNVKRYQDSDLKETKEQKPFDTEFVTKELLRSANSSTVESRIKANINKIQRGSSDMNANFSRRH